MKIFALDEMKAVLPTLDLLPEIEAGFVGYSSGRSIVPPVGELLMEQGEVHIKYGCLKDDPYYLVKVASGFYENPKRGLPRGNGPMVLFSQATGEPEGLLLDAGYLTDLRTAVAGTIAAKYLAPQNINRIGIMGTGRQARLQLIQLKSVVACRDVLAFGRTLENLASFRDDMEREGFTVATTSTPAEIGQECGLIVTTTSATEPLLKAGDIRPQTHIIAIGSDEPDKHELEAIILAMADLVVADSIAQCRLRGEISKALEADAISENQIVELGGVIAGRATGRQNENDITIFDSTGVAVHDIQIAMAAFESLTGGEVH